MDFDTFTTNGPVDTSETNGGECQDSLTISTVKNYEIITLLTDILYTIMIHETPKITLISEYWPKCSCNLWRKFRTT